MDRRQRGTGREDTERRHSETAPREIEGFFEEFSDQDNPVLQNVPDMITVLDANSTIRYVSPVVEGILGYPSEELLGTGALDYVHPEDIEFVSRAFAEALKKAGMMPPIEFRFRRADGSWRHVEMIPNNRLDDPAVRAMGTTTRDVTGRRRSEERLRQSEERLRAQYNGFPAPTFSWRKVQDDFELVDYNEAADKSTRGGLAGLLGTRASEWYADKPQILDMLSRCFSEGITIQGESAWRMVTEGEHKHFAVTFAYVPPDLVIHRAEDITERKRAEEELKESEERFRATFEQAAVGIAHNALDGRWLRVNQKVCNILGYTREELLQKTFQEVTHPDDLKPNLGYTEQLLAGEIGSFSMEKRYIRKDGSVIWGNVTVSLVRGTSGEPSYSIAVLEDITERKQAEEKNRFQAHLLGAVGQSVIATDLEGHITYWNRCAEDLYGWSEEEVMGRSVMEVIPSEGQLEQAEEIMSDLMAGRSWSGECEVRRKDGTSFPAMVTDTPVHDEQGSLVGIIGVSTDITELKETEELLRSEASLTEAQRIAHLGSWEWNIKTGEVFWSDEAYCIYGFEPKQFSPILETVEEIFHPDDRHLFRAIIDDAYLEAESYDFEHRIVRPDGEVRWVHRRGEAVRGEGGELLRMVGTVHDITEHKQAEESLKHSLNALLAVHEAGHLLSSTLEPEEIGSRILGIMRRISGLTTAVISLWDERNEQLKVWQSIGLEELAPKVRYRLRLREARDAVLESDTPRLFRLDDQEEEGDREDEPVVGLFLPLRVRERTVGVLETYGPAELGKEPSVAILESLAGQATGAFENARLYGELAERERRLQELVGTLLEAQEEERRRVSYEVHDGLAQVATSAHHHLQAYAQRYLSKHSRSREKKDLGRSLRLVKQTVSEARRVIANLRPRELDDSGLAAAVSQEVKRLRQEGWRVDYEQNLEDERLPAQIETALFRAAQEALTNARKHATARRLRLELSKDERTVRLGVRDWGQGFDPDKLNTVGPGERVGIAGMRERVALLGGRFELWSQLGEGTSVSVEVPLSATTEYGHGEG